MKKYLSLALVLILIAAAFTGCKEKFDMDNCIEKLKDQGLTEGMCYITEEECARATSLANSEIKFMGGDFTVEIVKQYSLIENGDYSKSCTFIKFATEEQAREFAELKIADFAKDGNTNYWKIAHDSCVAVLTNLEAALKIIPLDFQ